MTNRDTAGTARIAENTPRALAVAVLLGAALLVGGRNGAFNHLVVQLASLPLLYLLLADRSTRWPLAAKFAGGALAVAALQLVPLPPALWTALPGGPSAADALRAAGLAIGWRSLALDPFAAASALLTLVPPLLLFTGAANLPPERLRNLLLAVAIFAGISAALGIVQRVTGGLALYETDHRGTSTGLMINRNHHADLIIGGMLLLPLAALDARRAAWRWPLTATVLACALAVLATTSRMGLLLVAPAALASLAMLWRLPLRWWLPLALALGLGGLAASQMPAFAPVFARLEGAGNDERVTIAANTLAAIREFWPWGSGYGSFMPVYDAFEDLDLVHARHVVAAHDDYLQIVLEGGLPGLLTLIGALGIVALQGWRLWQRGAGALGWAPWSVAVVLLVHSAFDYPLRMAALAALFALCLGAGDAVANRRIPT